jgi:hypothetical protein
MSAVDGLAAQAAAFMVRAGYSPGSRASYQRVWGQFGDYCVESGVRDPDREAADRFCAAAGADGVEQWQVFYRRAVGCLFGGVRGVRMRRGWQDAGSPRRPCAPRPGCCAGSWRFWPGWGWRR